MPRPQSQTEIRAERLIEMLSSGDIMRNDQQPNSQKLYLSDNRLGVSVIKDGRLYFDDYKTKRPKCYTSLTPDYSWGSSFIEVKDNISGDRWDRLTRDSLNDQIRVSLLRARVSRIEKLIPSTFAELSCDDQRLTRQSLADFPQSDPELRLYLHWETLISAISSPDDNFIQTVVNICGQQRPLKLLNVGDAKDKLGYYMLDSAMLDKWEQLSPAQFTTECKI